VRVRISRHSLEIIPETIQDEVFLEEVLGLEDEGDSVPLSRVNAYRLSCWAYAKAARPQQEDE